MPKVKEGNPSVLAMPRHQPLDYSQIKSRLSTIHDLLEEINAKDDQGNILCQY
jgi:hypothetical protein